MSLTAPSPTILRTTHADFASERAYLADRVTDREQRLDVDRLSEGGLKDLLEAAKALDDKKVAKAVEAILRSRSGDVEGVVPNFKAFVPMLRDYLRHHCKDGWIYVTQADGMIYPELVESITTVESRDRNNAPYFRIATSYYGMDRSGGHAHRTRPMDLREGSYTFHPGDVVRRRIPEILRSRGIHIETKQLRAAHDEAMKRYQAVVAPGFSHQFRFSGPVLKFAGSYGNDGAQLSNRKVIHDLAREDFALCPEFGESEITPNGEGAVPRHPVVRVFDLKVQEFFWAHADHLHVYVYDKTIRDKLILPELHHDLLDILTTDIDAFVDDLVEGKSSGNVILSKGLPGTGKTLSAEAYAEIMEKPLYAINAGSLGTDAETISRNLRMIFERAKRWNCVLLLDEADVFVKKRRDDLEQNAIVAEFLRVLDYVDSLLWLTTNRPDDIDEAILSRCAAIIDYPVPDTGDMRRIWRVQSDHFDAKLPDELIEDLLVLMPNIVARDANRLLRLVLRTARKKKREPDLEMFRIAGMFRAIRMIDREAA